MATLGGESLGEYGINGTTAGSTYRHGTCGEVWLWSFDGWYFEGSGMRVRLKFGRKAFEDAFNNGDRRTASIEKIRPLPNKKGRGTKGADSP